MSCCYPSFENNSLITNIMRKRLLLCYSLTIFMLFSFVRCSQEILDVQDNLGTFTKEARLYFEQNASDIQTVRVGNQKESLSRSMALSSRVITPNWEEGESIKRGAISSLEISLTGDVYVKSFYSSTRDGLPSLSNVQTKLVIQKHDELKEMRSFVVTIIAAKRYEIMHAQSTQTFSFLNPNNFSGLMIVSDLEGNYLDAFQFTDGKQQRVALAKASGMEETDIDENDVVSTFSLMDASSAGMYSRSGEGGGGGGTPVYPDIPEVTVTYCKRCGVPIEECPGHCPICNLPLTRCPGHYTPPPTQWQCPFCGSYYCPGSCRGGSGSGGAGDIPSMNDNTAALFKNHNLGNDIADFNKLMNEMIEDCAYKAIFEFLKTKIPFDKVEYDPNLGSGLFEGASAGATSTTLKFRNKATMTLENLKHEIYHMYQQRYFGSLDLKSHRHMIEFEERIYEDIAAFVRYGGNTEAVLESGHGFYCIYPGLSTYEKEYYAFLNKITVNGAKYGTLTNDEFYHWAAIFGKTSRVYPGDCYDYSVPYNNSINNLLNLAKQKCK